jgi:hypothetical protein
MDPHEPIPMDKLDPEVFESAMRRDRKKYYIDVTILNLLCNRQICVWRSERL